MKKTLVIAVILISIAVLFSACTQTAEQPSTKPPQQNSGGSSAKIASQAEAAEGKLIGWIDGNSVEIQMTPEDSLAFRVTDVLTQLEGIKDGDMVKFSYKLNDEGQMIITKIEKLQ